MVQKSSVNYATLKDAQIKLNKVECGVCKAHGAKVKLCNKEGCTNRAKQGGVCTAHGANTVQN